MNFLLMTDSYKASHVNMYPKHLRKMYSYFEARGGEYPYSVFYGLQYILREYLAGIRFNVQDIANAERFWASHFGSNHVFNAEAWRELYDAYEGALPIEIKAVDEGSVIPTHNVLFSIENTDERFPWLVGHIESILMKVWYPTVIATRSHRLRKQLLSPRFIAASANWESAVDFSVHDFSYRGHQSEESAQLGSSAHLLSFCGTDTVSAIEFLYDHYSARDMMGYSVPAAEHSVIMSYPTEREAFNAILEAYPSGIVSVVSDTYDYRAAVETLWCSEFKDKLATFKGKVVIRPDSGDPCTETEYTLHKIKDLLGTTQNRQGFHILPPYLGVIWGDGMNETTIPKLFKHVVDEGFVPESVVAGSGTGLMGGVTRDTQRIAIKASLFGYEGGVERAVSKSSKTDVGKASKRGRLALVYHDDDYQTVNVTPQMSESNLLTTVFKNGMLLREHTFEEIRDRLRGVC